MLDGIYSVSLNTPLGSINGKITLITNGNNVQGIVETMGMKNGFNGVKIANDKCKFSGNLNTPIGNLNYNAICYVSNDILELEANTPQGNIKISGKRVKN